MPRKAFVADLQAVQTSLTARGICDVQLGDEDGTITFYFDPVADGHSGMTISALIPDLAEYPVSHIYLVYTISENVPACVNSALADLSIFNGLRLPSMLAKVSEVLDHAMATAGERSPTAEDGNTEEPQANPSDEEAEPDVWEEAFVDEVEDVAGSLARSHNRSAIESTDPKFLARVRSDLLAVKNAGFRISYYGNLHANRTSYLVLSCRVAKLRVPDDALKAWHLDRDAYFVLLIRYAKGYRVLEELTRDPLVGRGMLDFRVGTSKKSRISLRATEEAFEMMVRNTDSKMAASQGHGDSISPTIDEYTLRGLFIRRPLEDVLNCRLLELVNYRTAMAIPWNGAEVYFKEKQKQACEDQAQVRASYLAPETLSHASNLPGLVTADHLAEAPQAFSFPLVAMQFALRHLVRCNEFCLVCHYKIENGFEALKPYVCENPLCLYQYMALGFGPSIEHEILNQPYVVDMLISLCYASAAQNGIRDLPVGLALMMPSVDHLYRYAPALHREKLQAMSSRTPGTTAATGTPSIAQLVPPESSKPMLTARFNTRTDELIMADYESHTHFRLGDWICLMRPSVGARLYPLEHRRVMQTFPFLKLDASLPSFAAVTSAERMASTLPLVQGPSAAGDIVHVNVLPYDTNFDDMSPHQKHLAIVILLDTLPPVLEMRRYLQSRPAGQASLQSWAQRLTLAALNLLRWIIASNRSCLIQVDSLDSTKPSEDRVLGMKNYMQFRFAQGAPGKESRFLSAVRATQDRLGLVYPTLLAWHGSPLRNWHGIIREGLNYDRTAHGRAFGNGVYLSLAATTSQGYSAFQGPPTEMERRAVETEWRQSIIKVRQALCLNEVVNAPSEFVSSRPHLVVRQLDWIQTRYLFVSCHARQKSDEEAVEAPPSQILTHDPQRIPLGIDGKPIVVPIAAVSRSRPPQVQCLKKGNKRARLSPKPGEKDEDPSDGSDTDELRIFSKPLDTASLVPARSCDAAMTAFEPGCLDITTLSMMAEPPYASSLATRRLQGMLAQAVKMQESQPLHTLGWYVSANLDTVYQWLVELHSFDLDLPLAQDMQAQQIRSVVLEFRFGKDFPYSPPFVRVVRPRFRPLMDGGGGHITSGGAICMELLTNSGWNPASSIEAVLLQLRMAITSTDPPARLSSGRDYPISEALAAYRRACKAHGWIVPDDFNLISTETLAAK